MLLPTKGIPPESALLSIGANVLGLLAEPTSVSSLWERYQSKHVSRGTNRPGISFDWFSLALTFLFGIGVIEMTNAQQIERRRVS